MTCFKIKSIALIALFPVMFLSFKNDPRKSTGDSATIKIHFINMVGKSPVVLGDSSYINPFQEKYTITKLRYYVTNVSLIGNSDSIRENESYHLVDENVKESQSFSFNVPAGNYNSLKFLLGVDSLHNVSGAQSGDLDPTKDMFWTWNSGYVMAKMEGNSPASKLVNQKYEYHIGGYAGHYSVIRGIELKLAEKSMNVAAGKIIEIFITANINAWWQNPNAIKISETAIITSPGKNALAMSQNYSKMFSIDKIIIE